jgi:3'-5' exonuclease
MSNGPNKLIIDIETIGHDFDSFDKATQDNLTRWIEAESETEQEYEAALKNLKDGLGFSPLTGEIVAIGVLDHNKQQGVVYYQAPDADLSETVENNITYKPMTEAAMLDAFWKGALQYQHFITFNGRQFDAPFMMLRSAVHGVRPTKDLTRARYLYQQSPDAVHIDLLDQLSFYGAVRRKGTLHLYTRAFGIKSPKADGIEGDDVGRLFKEKKYLDIARYNAGDLFATSKLYEKWENYLRF